MPAEIFDKETHKILTEKANGQKVKFWAEDVIASILQAAGIFVKCQDIAPDTKFIWFDPNGAGGAIDPDRVNASGVFKRFDGTTWVEIPTTGLDVAQTTSLIMGFASGAAPAAPAIYPAVGSYAFWVAAGVVTQIVSASYLYGASGSPPPPSGSSWLCISILGCNEPSYGDNISLNFSSGAGNRVGFYQRVS